MKAKAKAKGKKKNKKENALISNLQKISQAAQETIIQYNIENPQVSSSSRNNNPPIPTNQINQISERNPQTSSIRSTSINNLSTNINQTNQTEVLSQRISPTIPTEQIKENTKKTHKKAVLIRSHTESEQTILSQDPKNDNDCLFGKKIKRNYTDFMRTYSFSSPHYNHFKESWPKYLGSLVIKEKFYQNSEEKLMKIPVGSQVKFSFDALRGKFYKPTKFYDNPEKWSFHINHSLYNYANFKISETETIKGPLYHKYNEIWGYLDHFNYICIVGYVIKNDYQAESAQKSSKKMKILWNENPMYIHIKIDVFLKYEFILNPINLALKKYNTARRTEEIHTNIPVRPTKINHFAEETKREAKEYGRICKEAIVLLFELLQIKKLTPSLIKLRKKTPLLDALRIKKYGIKHWTPNDAPLDERLRVREAYIPELKDREKFDDYYDFKEEEEKKEMNAAEQVSGVESFCKNSEKKSTKSDKIIKKNEENTKISKKYLRKSDFSEDFSDSELSGSGSSYIFDDEFSSSELEGDFSYVRRVMGASSSSSSSESEEKSNKDHGKGKESKHDITEHNNKKNDMLQITDSNDFKIYSNPPTMSSTLHDYQKQALTWMLYREGALNNQELFRHYNEQKRELSPLYEEIILMDGFKFYFNQFTGFVTTDFQKQKHCFGGILADEMGLGKTVMTIALMHINKWDMEQDQDLEKYRVEEFDQEKVEQLEENQQNSIGYDDFITRINSTNTPILPANPKKNPLKRGNSLIVVPLSVLDQWRTEIAKHSKPGSMKVYEFYQRGRKACDLSEYDVVLTTYDILAIEYVKIQKGGTSALFEHVWLRVILDEAQNIKTRGTRRCKAACCLFAKFRWCLSGTPIQNKLDDLFALLLFLRIEVFGEYFWWNTYINKFTNDNEAFGILNQILSSLLLRRTKKSTYSDGGKILELPDKSIEICLVKMSHYERQLYSKVHDSSRNYISNIINTDEAFQKYSHIFQILIRLRQICDHPGLIFKTSDLTDEASLERAIKIFFKDSLVDQYGGPVDLSNANYMESVIKDIKNGNYPCCAVCLEDNNNPAVSKCGHVLCVNCFEMTVRERRHCPLCRQQLDLRDIMKVGLHTGNQEAEVNEKMKNSSKLEKLFEYIQEVHEKKEKCVIYTQFLGMLTYIQKMLEENKIDFRRLEGKLSKKQRVKALDDFNNKPDVVCLLVSLQAGSVGLNLVVANHLFLIDPWWNPAVEDQAIERVHRIGQTKSVRVVRFICKDTVEERMIEIQEKKRELIKNVIFRQEERKRQNMEDMRYILMN